MGVIIDETTGVFVCFILSGKGDLTLAWLYRGAAIDSDSRFDRRLNELFSF